MKNTQKGSVVVVIILVAVVLVIAGVLAFYRTRGQLSGGNPVSGSPSQQPSQAVGQTQVDDSGVTNDGLARFVKDNNGFAWKIFAESKVGGAASGNVFVSPWSISSALAMTYEGAKGTTATEMSSVLNFFSDDNARRSSFANITNTLNKPSSDYALSSANALWAEKGYAFLPAYFSLVGKYYGGKVTNLDFKQSSEASRVTINNWVAKQTMDKIKDLMPKGSVNEGTRLVLTNAVYFKGKWKESFDKKNTKEANFNAEKDVQCIKAPCYPVVSTVKVQMMNKQTNFNYYEDYALQAVLLPYKGDRLSMVVLLPKKEGDNYINLAERFTANNSYPATVLQSLVASGRNEVNVFLPKFKFDKKLSLADTFKTLGMAEAFTGAADFSGMTGNKDLLISDVIHQAFVAVDEEGTEAAAATGVAMVLGLAPVPVPEFRADHPFIFVILENTTGQILFLGKVNDPSS